MGPMLSQASLKVEGGRDPRAGSGDVTVLALEMEEGHNQGTQVPLEGGTTRGQILPWSLDFSPARPVLES